MAKISLKKEFSPRRIFLRVPLKAKARIFIDPGQAEEIEINDISSGGLSFFVPASKIIPDYFKIEFHLEQQAKPIKAALNVRNRVQLGDKLRVGCSFFELTETDKNHITQFICRLTNLITPLKVLGKAAFFCFIDALWRIPAYFLYCRGVEFEKLSKISFSCRIYFFVLLFYAACSAVGFILSERLTNRFIKPRFLISAFCLFGAFIFVVLKAAEYVISSIGNPLPVSLDIFIWLYVFFAAYVIYAMVSVFAWIKKIDMTSQILERHSSFAAVLLFMLASACFTINSFAAQPDNQCLVRGIFYDEENPRVLINEDLFTLESYCCGGKITGIFPERIILEFPYGAREYKLGDSIRIEKASAATAVKEAMPLVKPQEPDQISSYVSQVHAIVEHFIASNNQYIAELNLDIKQDFFADKSEAQVIKARALKMLELIEDRKQKFSTLLAPDVCARYQALTTKLFDIAEDAWKAVLEGDKNKADVFFDRLLKVSQEISMESVSLLRLR